VRAVLDSGAFVAIDKDDREVAAMLRVLQRRRIPLWTSSAVVAQVWRDGRKQALLARILGGVGVRALGPGDDVRTGELLRKAKRADVIDGHVALLVDDGDQLLTSDPDDLEHLLEVRGVDASVIVT
jgi:hypothetical protein